MMCPQCGAPPQDGRTCEDAYYQMLAWEFSDAVKGSVHHLTVPAYHLQHPAELSADGWQQMLETLRAFVQGNSPQAMRARIRRQQQVDKVSLRRGSPARAALRSWSVPVHTCFVDDPELYCQRVRVWAAAVVDDLRKAGFLPA
jgi:hypothetical protein